MHSRHAAADGPPPPQTNAKGKGKEEQEARGPPAVQRQEREKGRREDGWTTVEHRRHGGGAKRARKAEIVGYHLLRAGGRREAGMQEKGKRPSLGRTMFLSRGTGRSRGGLRVSSQSFP